MTHSSNAAAARALAGQIGALTQAGELRAGRGSALVWPLGWPEVDAVLSGGVPRGQVTEWAGTRSTGKTAVLRRMAAAVRSAGVGVGYVDGTGTLAPAPWVVGCLGPGGAPPFWVVRPPAPQEVLAATEELLRSGAFGLIIAEGADWTRTPVIRLQRLAREAGAALVAVVERAGRVPLAALRVEFSPTASQGNGDRRVLLRGRFAAHELNCRRELPYRLSEDAGLPDRRTSNPHRHPHRLFDGDGDARGYGSRSSARKRTSGSGRPRGNRAVRMTRRLSPQVR